LGELGVLGHLRYRRDGLGGTCGAKYSVPRGDLFGEFHVELDSNQQHSIFFGNALIEAYETESAPANAEWIGITLCPSAWQAVEYIEPGLIGVLTSEQRFLRNGDCLRLHPFMMLRGGFQDHQLGEITCELSDWNMPEFPNDLLALGFIFETAAKFKASKDNGRVALKYYRTTEILTELLGAECVAWARKGAIEVAENRLIKP